MHRMDWDWDDLRFFLAAATEGSVTRAAASLGVNHSTVSRRLASLEAAFSTRLFERHPDGVQLTDDGRRIMDACRDIEAKTHDVARLIRAGDKRLAGHVRIAASTAVADGFITERLAGFRARYPDIVLELDLDIRPADLMRREADLALRVKPIGTKHEGAAILTRNLGPFAWALYGAPPLVQGPIHDEKSLSGLPFIGFPEDLSVRPGHEYTDTLGLVTVAQMSSVVSIAHAVKNGIGLGFVPCLVGRQHGLIRVTEPRNRAELWLLIHPELRENVAVRAVSDYFSDVDDEMTAAMAGLVD